MSNTAAKPRLADAITALKVPEFRRFWFAALASSSGSWLQGLASPFVMFELTGSGAWVGAGVFAIMLPMASVGPIAGPLADRLPRRRILLITQSILAVFAFCYAILWWTGVRTPWAYLGVTVLYGTANGFNMPAWQAFVSDLVPRELLKNAITLNSTQFNAARAIGPSIAGVVLAALGPGWAYFGNSMSFFVVLAVLTTLPTKEPTGEQGESPFEQFAAGWRYAKAKRGIITGYIAAAAVGLFGGTLVQVHMVLFAERVFEVGETRFGILVAAFGVGALTVAPWLASVGPTLRASRLLVVGITTYGVGELLLASTSMYWLGVFGVAIAGASHITMATTTNSSLQLMVDDSMRGRVMSLYLVVLTLAMPIGAIVQGPLADSYGPRAVVSVMGCLLLATAALLHLGGWAKTFDHTDL